MPRRRDRQPRSPRPAEDPPTPSAPIFCARSLSDLLAETAVPATQLARERGLHYSAIFRWMTGGARRGCGGGQVRLESYRLGGTIYTTREAIERFVAAQSADIAPAVVHPAPRQPGQRRRAAERAVAECERQGA
jgi:hypothetical protein